MQGQKICTSLYTGIVCDDSSLAPPSGTPRASSPTIIIAAGDTFIPHFSLLTPHSSFLTPHSSLLTKRGLTKGWKCAIVISIGLNAMTEISSLLRNFRELSRKHFYKVWIHSWAVRWESFCVRRNDLHTLQCYGFAFCWACKVGSFPINWGGTTMIRPLTDILSGDFLFMYRKK